MRYPGCVFFLFLPAPIQDQTLSQPCTAARHCESLKTREITHLSGQRNWQGGLAVWGVQGDAGDLRSLSFLSLLCPEGSPRCGELHKSMCQVKGEKHTRLSDQKPWERGLQRVRTEEDPTKGKVGGRRSGTSTYEPIHVPGYPGDTRKWNTPKETMALRSKVWYKEPQNAQTNSLCGADPNNIAKALKSEVTSLLPPSKRERDLSSEPSWWTSFFKKDF